MMKKRILTISMVFCALLILLPTTVFAATAGTVKVGGVELNSTGAGNIVYATTNSSGTVTLITDGTVPADNYVKFENGTLTLHNATIIDAVAGKINDYAAIFTTGTNGDLTIVLEGENKNKTAVVALSDTFLASMNGIDVSGDLLITGKGSLEITGNVANVATAATYNYSYAISGENITIKDQAKVNARGLTVKYGLSIGIDTALDGTLLITDSAEVTATGGNITINSGQGNCSYGVCCNDLTVSKNGKLTAASGNITKATMYWSMGIRCDEDFSMSDNAYVSAAAGYATDGKSFGIASTGSATALMNITGGTLIAKCDGSQGTTTAQALGKTLGTLPGLYQWRTTATGDYSTSVIAATPDGTYFELKTIPQYTVTVQNDGNGGATASVAKAAEGAKVTLYAAPNPGYHFKEWQVISGGISITENSFTMPQNNVMIKGIFEADAPMPSAFSITALPSANGIIATDKKTAATGEIVTMTISPADGYRLKSIIVLDDLGQDLVQEIGLVISNNSFAMPSANVRVQAIFEKINADGTTNELAESDGVVHFATAIPDDCTLDIREGSLPDSYHAENDITAKVFEVSVLRDGKLYPITNNAMTVRLVLPKALMNKASYVVSYLNEQKELSEKQVPVVEKNILQFTTNHLSDYLVEAKRVSFADVASDAYYADAVSWAVEMGITTGTSETTFSPRNTCTRGQMVTFLWRAAGEPEPKTAICSFIDISAEAYYYKAVLWAAEQNITTGITASMFSPEDAVTRGQALTFIFRFAGKPAVSSANPFLDVSADSYYYDAVLWGVAKEITYGTSSTAFSPNDPCLREQIVTLLYRFMV